VVAKLKDRLSVSKKQATQKFDMDRFDLRKLNGAEVKEQYEVNILNRFAAFENLADNVEISRAWENVRISTCQSKRVKVLVTKRHILWLNEVRSKLIDRRKQTKLQWLQNQDQMNGR
jgi:hypothetical protein